MLHSELRPLAVYPRTVTIREGSNSKSTAPEWGGGFVVPAAWSANLLIGGPHSRSGSASHRSGLISVGRYIRLFWVLYWDLNPINPIKIKYPPIN